MIAYHVISFCVVLMIQGEPVLSGDMEVTPRNLMVTPGQNVSILCQASHPLLYCRITLPGFTNALSLSPRTLPNKEYAYHGTGLAEGQCGVTLFSVEDKVNGMVECAGAAATEVVESYGQAKLNVLRFPRTVDFLINPSPTSRNNREFKEGEVLVASCVAKESRPVANITWYLGDEVLTSGIKTEITTNPKTNLQTIRQLLHRKLGWEDDSKELRCVTAHVALWSDIHSGNTFSVTYPPKYVKMPIELYGFTLNKSGNVTVEFLANPKPSILWIIGKSQLPEGQRHPGGNLEAMRAEYLGKGKWIAVLHINKVTQQDIDTEYYLRASNLEGHRTYQVVLSAKSGPGFVFGIGIMLGVVVIGAIVLVVAISVYVYVAGRRKRMTYSPTSEGASKVIVDSPLPSPLCNA